MTAGPPDFHPQRLRIESRYRGATSFGWYQADLGKMASEVKLPVWVYATWAPFEVNLIGSSSEDFAAVVDNSYVSSFANSLAKIALASQLFPGAEDYADLMRGNFKKFLAEQQYLVEHDGQGMAWVLEYMMEYNGRNRVLDRRLRETENGPALLRLLATIASNCILFHEIGHVAHRTGNYIVEARGDIDRFVEAGVGKGHGIPRLEVEVFCDIFSMLNTIDLAGRDGWDRGGLRNLFLFVLMGAFLCVKTRELIEIAAPVGQPVSLDPSDDILMARHKILSGAIDEILSGQPPAQVDTPLKLLFPDLAFSLPSLWQEATKMKVNAPETRIIAEIIATAFSVPELGGFDHVMTSLNQMSPLYDLSIVLGGSSIERLDH